MNKKQSPSQKKRGATVAAVLCFVAAIAIVGTYTLGNSREARQNEEIARTEENETKDNITEDSADDAREADSAVIDNQMRIRRRAGPPAPVRRKRKRQAEIPTQMEVLPAVEREAVEREAPVCRALQDPV